MMRTRLLLFVFGSILIAAGNVSAKPSRGIVPLHSNCDDVKRLLGRATCKFDSYRLENENVFIRFSEKRCDGDPIGWDVPIGTVLSIDVHPKNKPKLSDLIENPSRFTQTPDAHLPDEVYYTDKEEGFTLRVYANGEVGSLYYGPNAEDLKLCCSSATISTELPDGAQKFDEFGKLKSSKEKFRLNYFATQLRALPTMRGYIVIHSHSKRPNEWQVAGERIKKYLVVQQRLSEERLLIVKGPGADELKVELYVVPPGSGSKP